MAGTNLKAEFVWGTRDSKTHIVSAGKKYSMGRAKCGVSAERWGVNEMTLEQVRATEKGICARCAHHVSASIE